MLHPFDLIPILTILRLRVKVLNYERQQIIKQIKLNDPGPYPVWTGTESSFDSNKSAKEQDSYEGRPMGRYYVKRETQKRLRKNLNQVSQSIRTNLLVYKYFCGVPYSKIERSCRSNNQPNWVQLKLKIDQIEGSRRFEFLERATESDSVGWLADAMLYCSQQTK